MNSLFAFVKSKTFLKQFGIIVVAWVVFTWIVLSILGFYTHHGEKVEVPNFRGIEKGKLEAFLQDKDLRYLIVDSVFDMTAKKGVVADQVPLAGSFVKRDRIIYLTVNATLPPKVKMPNLIDLTLRQATARIETYGLRVGRMQYVPDLAKNAILKQLIGNKEIKPGSLVNKGSSVNLVVGSGLGSEDVYLPNLIGLTKSEAISMLQMSSLSVGSIIFDGSATDTANAKVYRQLPLFEPDVLLGSGQSIDIFLTTNFGKIKDTIQ